MEKQHWEQRFKQLMNENLIDLPADYFDDNLPFNDPARLDAIFTELEEENLRTIHSM